MLQLDPNSKKLERRVRTLRVRPFSFDIQMEILFLKDNKSTMQKRHEHQEIKLRSNKEKIHQQNLV